MNTNINKTCFLSVAASLLLATSCQEEDFGYTATEIAYRINFEKVYGKVKPDQVWDLTTYNLKCLGLTGGPSARTSALTRSVIGEDEPYPVSSLVSMPQNKTIPGIGTSATTQGDTPSYKSFDLNQWIKGHNPERIAPVTFAKPTSAFAIIPFLKQTKGGGNADSYEWPYADIAYKVHLVDLRDGVKTPFDYVVTDNTKNNKPIAINPDYIQGAFYIYLEIIDSSGAKHEERLATYLNVPNKITGVVDGTPSIVFGCEVGVGEYDFKDLGIILTVPQESPETKETVYLEDDIDKKYMIEDTGSTVDFDFNDIVVGVHYYKKTNIDGSGEGDVLKITAVLESLYGTIPFQLKIGSREFVEMPGRLGGTQPMDAIYGDLVTESGADISDSGYLPASNNISVRVGGAEASAIIKFPERGACPFMIAVDPDVAIPDEGANIDASWFETTPNL